MTTYTPGCQLIKGVAYYRERETARAVCSEILGRKAPGSIGTRFPMARIVDYIPGHAIQYYPSGPYYPELENVADGVYGYFDPLKSNG